MAGSATAVLDHSRPQNSRIDCRVYERRECDVPTTCQPASVLEMKEFRWTGTIVDISQGGVRLKVQRRFEKGAPLAIELPGDGEHDASVAFVKVMHLASAGDGSWTLGCKFISELSEEEVQRLLTPQRNSAGADRTETPPPIEPPTDVVNGTQKSLGTTRVLVDVSVEIESDHAPTIRCWINRFDVTKCWPMMAGTRLTIRGVADDGRSRRVKIEVVELTQIGQRWKLCGRLAESRA